MAGTNLTEEELRAAAAEAGISPQELRTALAEREQVVSPAPKGAAALLRPTRGATALHVEGRVSQPPREALASVRGSIETQTGLRGHAQGEGEADIVDDQSGLTYRMRTDTDGSDGALVRVDVDPTSGRGTQALATTGVAGITITLIALGWLFGATTLWLGGLGVGVLGGLFVLRHAVRLAGATRHAQGIAAQALVEAEDRAEGAAAALPPAR